MFGLLRIKSRDTKLYQLKNKNYGVLRMKRLITLLAAGIMILGLGSMTAFAAGEVDAYDNEKTNVTALGTAGVISADGPAKIEDYLVSNFHSGSKIRIDKLDFGSDGPKSVAICGNTGNETGMTVEMRLDSADGALVGTFVRGNATSDGWSGGIDLAAASFDIQQKITGVHTIYLIITGGGMNFRALAFTGANTTNTVPVDDGPDPNDPGNTNSAYSQNALRVSVMGPSNRITIVEKGTASGAMIDGVVSHTGDGLILKIANVEFGSKGAIKAHVRGLTGDPMGFEIDVMVDSATDGEYIGSFIKDGPTGEMDDWSGDARAVAASFDIVPAVTGKHDIFLRFRGSGALNLYGIHFDEKPANYVEPTLPPTTPATTAAATEYVVPGEVSATGTVVYDNVDTVDNNNDGDRGLNLPLIIGCIAGGVLIIGGGVIFMVIHKRKSLSNR